MEILLLFLAGVKRNLIKDSRIDKFYASVVGLVLLMVGIYAITAWTFFFQTVFTEENSHFPLMMGIFMGCFVVFFDRALISSMSSRNKIPKMAIIFRFLLAIVLGVFLSQPMILRFYHNDIEREAQLLLKDKSKDYKVALDKNYSSQILPINQEVIKLEGEIKEKKQQIKEDENDYRKEMDGTGGTGYRGYGDIAKKKKEILENHQKDLEKLEKDLRSSRIQIDSLNKKKTADYDLYMDENKTSGILIQTEALQTLMFKDKTKTLLQRYILLSVVLILIEVSALIAKLMFKTESYQRKIGMVTGTEIKNFETNEEISLRSSQEYSDKLWNTFHSSMEIFFNETRPTIKVKLDKMIKEWESKGDLTYRDLCQRFMDELMIQDINLNLENNNGAHTMKSTNYNDFFNNKFITISIFIILTMFFFRFCVPEHTNESHLTVLSIIVSITGIALTFEENIKKSYASFLKKLEKK